MMGLIVFAIQFSVSGLLLKTACWFCNHLFAGSPPTPNDDATNVPPLGTTQTVGNHVASEADDTNPYSPPRQTAKPAINKGPQVVVPTVAAAIGLGFLLTGLQLFAFGVGLLWPMLAGFSGIGIGVSLAATLLALFAVTVGFVTVLLTGNFARGVIVTGIYYGLLLALASPVVVLRVLFLSPL